MKTVQLTVSDYNLAIYYLGRALQQDNLNDVKAKIGEVIQKLQIIED